MKVLIGSSALKEHGLPVPPPTDVDILCKQDVANEIAWAADTRIGPRLFGFIPRKKGAKKEKLEPIVVDVSLYDDGGGKSIIYDLMLSAEPFVQTPVGIATLPPLEWLGALVRGHTHRVPHIGTSKENVNIWIKYMNSYVAIRDKVGYLPCTEGPTNLIYEAEFEHVNRIIGDAHSRLGMAEAEFFADNVKRHVDHDELHREVARMNRGVDELLFKRFQSGNGVEMDETLFMAAPAQERLDVLREEVMVLFLERKAIPAAAECGERLLWGDDTLNDLQEIICHFCTNLSGTGWLRRYALDHWHMFNKPSTYPQAKMSHYANTFCQAANLFEVQTEHINTLDKLLAYRDRMMPHNKSAQLAEAIQEKKDRTNTSWNGPVLAPVYSYGLVEELEEGTFERENEDPVPRELARVIQKFFTGTDLLIDMGPIFNLDQGIGFRIDQSMVYLFETDGDGTFGIHRFDFSDNSYDSDKLSYSIETRSNSYYHSTCSGGYDQDVDERYLNNYGHTFAEIDESTLEAFARLQLEFHSDEDNGNSD